MKKSFPLIFVTFIYFTFLGGSLYSLTRFPLKVFNHAAVTLILGLWLWRTLKRPAQPSAAGAILLPLAGWLAVQFVSAGLSADPRASFEWLWQPVTHAIAFLMLADLWPRYRAQFVKAIYLSSAVVCLIGLAEFTGWYFGWPLLPNFQQGWPPIGGWANLVPPYWYRINFTLNGATSLSAYLALLIPPAIGLRLTTQNKEDRQALTVWLVLAVVVFGLTFSRGGIVALGVSLPVLLAGWIYLNRPQFLLKIRRVPPKILWGMAVLTLIVAMAGLGMIQQRMTQHTSGDQVRINLWQSAIRMAADHPLTGVGPKLYGRTLRSYRDPDLARDQITTAHNLYLNTAAETGLPGLLAGAWLISVVGWLGIKNWQTTTTRNDRLRLLSVGGALLGFGAQAMVDTFNATQIILPVLLGAAYLITPQNPSPEKRVTVFPQRVVYPLLVLLAGYAFFTVRWDTAQFYFEQSARLVNRSDLPAAISAIEKAVAIDPYITLYRAELADHQGRLAYTEPDYLQPAIDGYQAVLGIEGSSPVYQANLAGLLQQAGQSEAAIKTMRLAVELASAESRYLYRLNLGQMLEQANNHPEAIEQYAAVVEFMPELLDTGLWDASIRQEIIAAVTAASPNNPVLAATLALENHQPAQAEQLARRAIALEFGVAEAQLVLAQSLVAQNKPQQAEAVITDLLPQLAAETLGTAYLTRGQARFMMGKEAATDLKTALFINPYANAAAYYYLGQIDESAGNLNRAEVAYKKAVAPQFVSQDYEVVLYGRPVQHSPFLPQLISTVIPANQAEPWLYLLDFYTRQGKTREAARLKAQLQTLGVGK